MNRQLKTMLELQNAMNTKVNADWRQQNFEWYRAIWIESAELLDHYGWKWWKKQTPDREQVVLELVDIWHFGLSILLLKGDDIDVIAGEVENVLNLSPVTGDFKQDIEAFAQATLETKAFDIEKFNVLMKGVDLEFDELFTRYVGKNVLNFFRQDNGYQDGSYSKQWQGKEDNEHLVEIIDQLDTSCPDFKDRLYQELDSRYTALTA